jgi:nicotinamide-nucleotide adenylyltransferase
MTAPSRAARGLLVGRFQPFHLGHLGVVRAIRTAFPEEELVLAIGSTRTSYTWENPFTAGERWEMTQRALNEAKIDGVLLQGLPDIHRHALWVAHAEASLPSFRRVHTNNPLTQLLFERAGYPVEAPILVDRARFEGRLLRLQLAEDGPWPAGVPRPVAEYLRSIGAPARLRLLRPTDPARSEPSP